MKNIVNHIMRLDKEPFDMINSGIKTAEYRLNDDKRKKIKIGDTITFLKRPEEKEKIVVKVVDLKYYPTLFDMYTDTFFNHLNRYYKDPKEVVEDTTYYSEEEIKKYGCVAIFLKKLDDNFIVS